LEEDGHVSAVRDAPGARQAFDGITNRDGESSTNPSRVLFFYYARRGMGREALDHFLAARRCGRVDGAMLSCALKVCGSTMPGGEQLHCLCVKCGLDRGEVGVGTALVDMYMKRGGGSVEDGRRVFEGMPERNVVTWTALLTGCAQGGAHSDVVVLFFRMRAEGVRPSPSTFASVLSAVASQGALDVGRRVHAQSVKFGCGSTVVCNSLLNSLFFNEEFIFKNVEILQFEGYFSINLYRSF
jgi:pentatricopeptide repeat protein